MKTRSKITNRIISVLCLGVFACSLVALGFGTYNVISLYVENQNLLSIKESLENNLNTQNQFDELHYDSYYSVYVEGDYAIFDDTEDVPLIYFTK